MGLSSSGCFPGIRRILQCLRSQSESKRSHSGYGQHHMYVTDQFKLPQNVYYINHNILFVIFSQFYIHSFYGANAVYFRAAPGK